MSFDALQRMTRVADKHLDIGIGDSDLPEIATHCGTADDYVEKLELSAGEQTDVRTESSACGAMAGMLLALKCWVRKKASKATFRALIIILLLFCKGDDAIQICYYINRKCELLL